MKHNYNLGNTVILFLILLTTTVLYPQCMESHSENGSNVESNIARTWGQGFTAPCSGYLNYVQLISNSTGTVPAGTLFIYSGDTVSNTPIYMQEYSPIEITQSGMPIRVTLTGPLSLVEGNQYAFQLKKINYVDVLLDYEGWYAGGSAFNGHAILPGEDFIFGVNITSSLQVDDFNVSEHIRLFPNPSANFITISKLREQADYSIINVFGQEVLKGRISNDEKLNISQLNKGIYFLKLNNLKAEKFIKE